MQGLRDAIENDNLNEFVDEFYRKQGQERPE
jgi:queuine/archaeosine tRNA-ribosyltransferase